MTDLQTAKALLHRAIDEMELTVDDVLLLTALTTASWAAHPAAIFQQLQADFATSLEDARQPTTTEVGASWATKVNAELTAIIQHPRRQS